MHSRPDESSHGIARAAVDQNTVDQGTVDQGTVDQGTVDRNDPATEECSEDASLIERNLQLQREWYGEPLGDRVRRLIAAFDVSQAHLAEVLGVSPPMLSQVMSGRRGKIGNPGVLARMVMLERRVLTPEVAAGQRGAIGRALEEVKASRPTVGVSTLPVDPAAEPESESLLGALREHADVAELRAAARLLAGAHPRLAGLLRRAAELPQGG